MTDFASFLSALRPQVDDALDRLLAAGETGPAAISEAMRYSVFAGGKRVRPALVVLAGEACGARGSDLLAGGAAIEMIHTFSLVHDDLPALDDDDLRRGRPTLHKVQGEAMAILAGDALLNQAFAVLAAEPASVPPEQRLRAVRLMAEAVGVAGMIGGQVLDLKHEGAAVPNGRCGRNRAARVLERIHRLKTGALIEASTRLGGIYAGAGTSRARLLGELGSELGLLFQISDDILDEVGSSEQLGKTAGKDRQAVKLTYPRLFGLDRSRERARQAADRCLAMVEKLPARRQLFRSLVAFLVHRGS